MNLPDIMRLDDKGIDQAIEEALEVLQASDEFAELSVSNRYLGTQLGLSQRFMSAVEGAARNLRQVESQHDLLLRMSILAFLGGWLAHARLEQPKWAENLEVEKGKVN